MKMMKRGTPTKKSYRLLAWLLLLLLCLSACSGGTDTTVPDDSSEAPQPSESVSESTPETEPTVTNPDGTITLFADKKTEYSLILPDNYNQATIDVILDFVDKVTRKTGFDLFTVRTSEDKSATDKEIIIGNVTKRPESLALLREMSYTGYRVEVVGQKVIVCAHASGALEDALQKLYNAISRNADGDWAIKGDFHAEGDLSSASVTLPSFYETKKGYIAGVYYADEKYFTVNLEGTDLTEYQTYVAKLKSDGFTEYSTNKIGDNLFGTYTITGEGGAETTVHTMFYPNLKRCNIVYGPKNYLPSVEEVSAPTTPLATPTIYQLERQGVLNSAPGMLIAIQLADASFIIIDGGAQNATDAQDLLSFLVSKTPNGAKPVISAWIITHAHGDHMGLANYFLGRYNNNVELKMVAYNFPAFDDIAMTNESASSMKALANTFKMNVKSLYKNAVMFSFHTGQRLNLAGCVIEFLYTPEDYTSDTFPWGNHSCTAFRIMSDNTTFMVLGDCEATLCAQMAKTYKTEMKSDILQPTHHGFNGGDLTLYKYVDPDICLWAVDDARFKSDIPTYNYNKWLLDNAETHYTASTTTAVPFS